MEEALSLYPAFSRFIAQKIAFLQLSKALWCVHGVPSTSLHPAIGDCSSGVKRASSLLSSWYFSHWFLGWVPVPFLTRLLSVERQRKRESGRAARHGTAPPRRAAGDNDAACRQRSIALRSASVPHSAHHTGQWMPLAFRALFRMTARPAALPARQTGTSVLCSLLQRSPRSNSSSGARAQSRAAARRLPPGPAEHR